MLSEQTSFWMRRKFAGEIVSRAHVNNLSLCGFAASNGDNLYKINSANRIKYGGVWS